MTAVIHTLPAVPGSRIAGMGHYRPERVVTNDDLAKTMDTNDEWIRTRVGIAERRFAAADETVASMGALAGGKALADAGITPDQVDTVITATCTADFQIPHTSTTIAATLGIHAPGSFDVNAACAGFCYALAAADQAIRTGNSRTVLVVGSEKLTRWINPTDRGNAIIFGDGAGAAVVTAADRPEIGPVAWGSDETQTRAIGTTDAGWIYQEGQAVFRWATSAIAPVAIRAAAAAGVDLADIDVIATHQANLRIIEAIARKLISAGVRPDVRLSRDIVTTGNTSSASIPIGLDRMREAGEARSGDLVLAVGFGAGLTFAGQVFRCP